LRADNATNQLCLDIVAAGIACYSAHTNLDVVPGGVNEVLAEALDLMDTAPLIPVPHAHQVKLVTFVPEADLEKVRNAVCQAGAGVIGDYSFCSFSGEGVGTFRPGDSASPYSGEKGAINEEHERRFETLVTKARLPAVLEALFAAHPYEEVAYDVVTLENTDPTVSLGLRGRLETPSRLDEFAEEVRHALDVSHVRVVGDPDRPIKNVAVLGGAGGGLAGQIPDDIDVYVTGDVKYHEAQDALERGLAIIDAGHHGTEKWIVPVLAKYLKSQLDELRVATFIEAEVFRVITD
jgi:dinuclear metal center YbgI/SA1388 family protein